MHFHQAILIPVWAIIYILCLAKDIPNISRVFKVYITMHMFPLIQDIPNNKCVVQFSLYLDTEHLRGYESYGNYKISTPRHFDYILTILYILTSRKSICIHRTWLNCVGKTHSLIRQYEQHFVCAKTKIEYEVQYMYIH